MSSAKELTRTVNESSLPSESAIGFREPSAWEEYHWQIIAFVSAITLQGVVIASLLIERRRRRAAEF
ncbi:UNVERIFIED_CONTAM: sensor histidine kinase, partial [Bacteroidetes bacterium 56_B9]